ncbi:hypothetical protein IFM89_024277 [Coptis chinensis]|uniref:non-specific serine/threonine protein kinase n=1 Tax=Coptis chinensis TaxID=261450 RepID=A0A835LNA9_9MAGN|nr:hypothetical protein IFM89_024277 [Coptis chinensis]
MGNFCCGKPAQVDHRSSNISSTPGTSTTIGNGSQLSVSSAGNSLYSNSGSVGVDLNPNGQILPTPNLRIFSFAELKNATKNFKSDTVLGEGGFGKVFKGWIDDKPHSKNGSGYVIAVKKLNSESMQGFEEWQSEVNFLGRLSHPNLVKLMGYCGEDSELLLVYEFMQKGSLENHLFRRGSAVQPLSWSLRLKIALGAARGLAFLHSSEKQIIYRDFKASNILLDGNYNAKLSDFGLAKNGPMGGASHVTTRVMGTYGYAAPEYVATGQRALDTNRPSGQHNLVDWLKPSLSDRRKLVRIMDPRLEGQYPSKGAIQAAQLTLKCLGPEPRVRPPMKEVVESLERIQAIKSKTKESRTRPSAHTRSQFHQTAPGNHAYQRSPRRR